MNYLTPAVVSQRQVKRLPRLALLAICAAYILPGLFGRDPWRFGDVIAFSYMNAIAQGQASWLTPEILGQAPAGGLIPYWIGAFFIKALPFLDAPFAARLPFALLLGAIFALTWYSCYYLAKTEPAQPISFAFGGEAHPNDYARTIADGSLLALIATFGLLLPGHETTPGLVQVALITLVFFCLTAAPFKEGGIRLCVTIALPMLGLSGVPIVGIILGLAGAIMCSNSEYVKARKIAPYFFLGTVLCAVCGWLILQKYAMQVQINDPIHLLIDLLKNSAWFFWPVWPLMFWALWSWRYLWRRRHISAPLVIIAISFVSYFFQSANKDYLLYALPATAILAAFAMPTFKRSIAALIDWFALMLFTILIMAGWFYWYAMITGMPQTPSEKLLRLVPGFTPSFSVPLFVLAFIATVAWLFLVRWRTGRHQPAIWKGMVLSAGGVTTCWLILMTLGLDIINYARSMTPWTDRIEAVVTQQTPLPDCLSVLNLSQVQIAALSWSSEIPLRPASDNCPYLLVNAPSNIKFIPYVEHHRWALDDGGIVFRPSDRSYIDRILIYRNIQAQ